MVYSATPGSTCFTLQTVSYVMRSAGAQPQKHRRSRVCLFNSVHGGLMSARLKKKFIANPTCRRKMGFGGVLAPAEFIYFKAWNAYGQLSGCKPYATYQTLLSLTT